MRNCPSSPSRPSESRPSSRPPGGATPSQESHEERIERVLEARTRTAQPLAIESHEERIERRRSALEKSSRASWREESHEERIERRATVDRHCHKVEAGIS